ncbi:MAG: hypothetical protein J7539_16200, partial [Niabella sp.]|nr:hypothetical protein [Niabella sp.]
VNHFLSDGLENLSDSLFFVEYRKRLLKFDDQGYTHERNYSSKRISKISTGDEALYSTFTSRETFPSIPLGSTVYNYINGTKAEAENVAFDFYSGMVTKALNVDADGNRFLNEQIPAYRVYSDMGMATTANKYKNMLTQTAASYSYKVDAGNSKLGLVSASVNTWGKDIDVLTPEYNITQQDGNHSTGKVWRPKMTYAWSPTGTSPNGMTAIGMFANFDWSSHDNPNAQDPGWIKIGQLTLYDVFSHALEASDINDQFAATKMGYNQSKVMVTGGPARYTEIAYSGAEDNPSSGNIFNGDIKLASASVQSNLTYVHTGAKSVQLINGTGFQYDAPINKLDNTRDYWASVWLKSGTGTASNAGVFYNNGSGQVNGTLSAPNSQGWQLATIQIPASAISGSTLTIGCYNSGSGTVYFDDLRFHPLNAGVSAYVYDNFSGELTYILDNNNFYTKFEYDAVGRLVKTYRETIPDGVRPVNEYQYNYGREIFRNDLFTNWSFTKNDCSGVNVAGSTVTITIPQGLFTSYISREDANQMAMNYGQQQANLQGTCNNLYAVVEYNNYYTVQGYDTRDIYADVYIRVYDANNYPSNADVSFTYQDISGGRSADGHPNCNVYEYSTNYPVGFSGPEYVIGYQVLISHEQIDPITYDTRCEEYRAFNIIE